MKKSKLIVTFIIIIMILSNISYAVKNGVLNADTNWKDLEDSDLGSSTDSAVPLTLYTILVDSVSEEDVKNMSDADLASYIDKLNKYQSGAAQAFYTDFAGDPSVKPMQDNLNNRITSAKSNTNASGEIKEKIEETEKKKEEVDNKIEQNQEVIDKTNSQGVEKKSEEQTGILGTSSAGTLHTTDEIMEEANNFINSGKGENNPIEKGNFIASSSTLYNTLLSIGIVLAVAIGGYLGIKFMLSSAEDKAKVKESLVPYVAGCIIVFGGFMIWKLVVIILGGIAA